MKACFLSDSTEGLPKPEELVKLLDKVSEDDSVHLASLEMNKNQGLFGALLKFLGGDQF